MKNHKKSRKIFYIEKPFKIQSLKNISLKDHVNGFNIVKTPNNISFSYTDESQERRSLVFNLQDSSFVMYSNGHFISRFAVTGDKVEVSWNNSITSPRDQNEIIEQVKNLFKSILEVLRKKKATQ